MCIKINLKQTVLARPFFFVIYDDQIPFMHLSWGEEGLTVLTLRICFSFGLHRLLREIQTCLQSAAAVRDKLGGCSNFETLW